jgi:rhomboid-related protein 1/2/3
MMEKVFNSTDKDNSGFISRVELSRMLDEINFKMTGNREKDVQIMMFQVDTNSDGKISKQEFFTALTNPDARTKWGPDNYSFNFAMKLIARNHAANPAMLEKINQQNCWPPPVFMVLISVIELGVFLHYSEQECDGAPSGGLYSKSECPQSFSSVLAYRMCCRNEAWRFLSYALAHAGWGHLAYNLIIQLLFGVYLEVVNGPFRVLLVYIMGTLAGSMTSSIFDPTANVVGASGAVYTLVGAWVAFTTINWDTWDGARKYLLAAFLGVLTCLDFGSAIYSRYNGEDSNISFAGHMGGFLMGVTFGTYILKNDTLSGIEVYFKWFGISFACCGLLFGILFNSFNDPDVNGICPAVQHKCTYN